MGNINCENCQNLANKIYNKNDTENLEIIKNDSYISFQKETEELKLEENNINMNQIIDISNQTPNEKKEEEPINLKSMQQNNDNYAELEEKIYNNIDKEKEEEELKVENFKIPKKENPSSKVESKTRNIVNELIDINNNNNDNINNNISIKNKNKNEDYINNTSHKSEQDEKNQEDNQEDIQEDNKENELEYNNKNNVIELNIDNIFPKNKLIQLEENSILCHGFLEKIIKIPSKNKFIYNERFCILTKKSFAYFKSKENYLNLWKPLFSIDLKYIKKVEQTVSDDKIFYFGLICIINDETRKYVDKINTFVNSNENNQDEFLIGFRSKNKELILKWIIILNYLIENYHHK